MQIALVIPILYSPKNFWYKKALKSIEKSWEYFLKNPKNSSHSLDITLVFNQYSGKKLPELTFSSKNISVSFLCHSLNKGFTGAVNDGVWKAVYEDKSDWCLVLNDDVIVNEDFFFKIIPELKGKRAVVSCGIGNTDGSLQSTGLIYSPSGLTQPLLDFKKSPFFTGTAFFVSRKVALWSFRTFGFLLIEFFFAYAEDLELGIRLFRNKKEIYIYPEILLTHFGSITAKRGSEKQLYWGYRNLIFLILIHWSLQKIILFSPFIVFGQLYIFTFLLSRKYFTTYLKILWSVWKQRKILKMYRKKFYEELDSIYTI